MNGHHAGKMILALTLVSLPGATSPLHAEEQLYYEQRSDIPLQYRWDLSLQFTDRAAWELAIEELEAALPALDRYKGKVASSAGNLAEVLALDLDLSRQIGPIYVYAYQHVYADGNDADGKAMAGRAAALNARYSEASSFIQPEIAAVPVNLAKKLLKDKQLAPYQHYLDNIWRQSAHYRSPEVEEALAGSSLSGDALAEAFGGLSNADIEWPTIKGENGEEVVVSPGQYLPLRMSLDRGVRQRAYEVHMATVESYGNTFAATLGGKIQRDVWLARVHRYPSALDAALDGPAVPDAVVKTLVSAVHDNISAMHAYLELRRRVLGVGELQPWDTLVPLLPEGGRKYTFDEAWSLAMAFWRETYGVDYANTAQQALDQRWVDVYTNKGTQGGAFSWGTYRNPRYLFLNWGGTLEDVSTLVHEMGHSVHGVLADQAQPYQYSGFDLFVAEVGSVASETLFNEWMLARSSDPVERRMLLNTAIDNIQGTFITQIFFHEWEAEAHAMAERGEPLTAESLGKVYADLNDLYNGEVMQTNVLAHAGWARIPHFYRNFYVWKYATSYAAGAALAERFSRGDKTAATDYLKMLKLGGSVYPMDVLKAGGVDLANPEVIRAVMVRYGDLVVRLEKELLGS